MKLIFFFLFSVTLTKALLFSVTDIDVTYFNATYGPSPDANLSSCCFPQSVQVIINGIDPNYYYSSTITVVFDSNSLNNPYCVLIGAQNSVYKSSSLGGSVYIGNNHWLDILNYWPTVNDNNITVQYTGVCQFELQQSAIPSLIGSWNPSSDTPLEACCQPSSIQFFGQNTSFFANVTYPSDYVTTNSWCVAAGITGDFTAAVRSYMEFPAPNFTPVWLLNNLYTMDHRYATIPMILDIGLTTESGTRCGFTFLSENTTTTLPSNWINSPMNNDFSCCVALSLNLLYQQNGYWNASFLFNDTEIESNTNEYCVMAEITDDEWEGSLSQISNNQWLVEDDHTLFNISLNDDSTMNIDIIDRGSAQLICSFELIQAPTPTPTPTPTPSPNYTINFVRVFGNVHYLFLMLLSFMVF